MVGTSSAFLDLSFGLAPALLGIVVDASGYPGRVPRVGRRVGVGAGVLVAASSVARGGARSADGPV